MRRASFPAFILHPLLFDRLVVMMCVATIFFRVHLSWAPFFRFLPCGEFYFMRNKTNRSPKAKAQKSQQQLLVFLERSIDITSTSSSSTIPAFALASAVARIALTTITGRCGRQLSQSAATAFVAATLLE